MSHMLFLHIYESDAQIAFMLKNNLAYFAITEDSDLLTYGSQEVCCFHAKIEFAGMFLIIGYFLVCLIMQ